MKSPGRIRDDDIEEIRRRSPLPEVAADYMQVKKAGRQFRALCPFHAEKTPSFYVDPVKNLYHCHGCQEGGDVFRLVEKLETVSFVEAVERLARRAGVELRYEQMSPADRSAQKRRLRLIDAHRAAVDLYHRTLMGAEGADARAYLKTRAFTKEVAEAFRVGFSPSRRGACVEHLRTAGFADEEIVEAGLGMRAEAGGLVDRFRGRVMFPIFEVTGDPVAFGARRLSESDRGPKYLNSAESRIYKKAQTLYGLNWAKNDIVKASRALVVEGYTDVIALHTAGVREAVATCGTALGIEHLRTLHRFTQQVILSLDSDEAGGTAAERTYEQLIADAQQMGLTLRVVLMPPGDDPADSVAKAGPEGFRALVDGAVALLEFVLRREAGRYELGDPDAQARALGACVRLLARTQQQSLVDEYARRLSDWVKVDARVIYYELEKMKRTGAAPTAIGRDVLKRSSGGVRREREAIKLALQHAPLVKEYLEELGTECFSVPAHQAIWRALAAGEDPGTLAESLDADARRAFTELSVQPPAGEATERLVADIFSRLKESVVSRQIDELKARLQRINPQLNPAEHDGLFAELVELERVKRSLSEEGDR